MKPGETKVSQNSKVGTFDLREMVEHEDQNKDKPACQHDNAARQCDPTSEKGGFRWRNRCHKV